MSFINSTFRNTTVDLDGKSFHGDVFVNCKLVYAGGPLDWGPGNKIIDSKISLVGPAGNGLRLLLLLRRYGPAPIKPAPDKKGTRL